MYKKILIFSLVLTSIYGIYKIGTKIIVQNQTLVLVWRKNLIDNELCQINVYSQTPINSNDNFSFKINQNTFKSIGNWNFKSKYEFNFKTKRCQQNQQLIWTNLKYFPITFWNYLIEKMTKFN